MDTSSAVGRRRVNSRVNAEDQALDQIAKEVNIHTILYVVYVCIVNIKKSFFLLNYILRSRIFK